MANLSDKEEKIETAEEKARRLDEEEELASRVERPLGSETAEKAERLDANKAKKLVVENGKGELLEFIEGYDDLEKALEGIEDPEKKEEVKKENEFMRRQAEEYWNSLHADMERAEKDEEAPGKEEEGAAENNSEDRNPEEVEADEETEYMEDLSVFIDQIAKEDRSEEERALVERYEDADEEEKKRIIESTRQEYAAKLELKDYKTDEEEKKRLEDIEKDIAGSTEDSLLAKSLMDKDMEFANILEEGSSIIEKGDPAEVGKYFEDIAVTFEDAARYLRTVYLRMEEDPEMKEALKDQYISIVTSIRTFEATAEKLRNIIKKTQEARELARNLTDEEKKEMAGVVEYLKALALLLGTVGAMIMGFIKYSKGLAIAAEPVIGKAVGVGFAGIGGSVSVAKLTGVGVVLALIYNEEKRDAFIEWVAGQRIPGGRLTKPKPKG